MKGQSNKNINGSAPGLEAVGTSMKTPYSQKQKENIKTQANLNSASNPFAQKSKLTPPNPYIVQHGEKEIVGLNVVGKRLDDAKSTKDILERINTHTFKESKVQDDQEYIREAQEFSEKHVIKRVTKSGGFKIPEENIEKSKVRKKVPKPMETPKHPKQKEFDDTRNDAGMSKLQILQQLGITDEDEGIHYDRLQDRIYDNKLEEQLSHIVEDQVFDRIDQIHNNRDELMKKREQVLKEKERAEKEKQENWDRLTGNQKYKPKYINQNEIEEEEFEESNNLEREVEDYYTQKYNLELSDRLKRAQEEEDDMTKSYKERFFEDKNRFANKKKGAESEDTVQKFFETLESMEKPTLEETEQTLIIQRKKLRYLEKQMKRSKGIEVSDDEEDEQIPIHQSDKSSMRQSEKSPKYSSGKNQMRQQDNSPRRIHEKNARRLSDKSPLNIQSTISHHGQKESNNYYSSELRSSQSQNYKSPRNNEKNRVTIKESYYDRQSGEIESNESHQIEQKLKNIPKFQNPYRRGDSSNSNNNNQDNRSKSPFVQQSQPKQPPIDPEVREYDKFEKEFKNFVVDRKKREQVKHLEHSLEKKDFELYQSTSPNPVNWSKRPVGNLIKSYEKSLSPDHMLSNSKTDINLQNKHQELKMIQTLFDKIDKDQTGIIDKLDSMKYLIKQKQIMSIYDLTSQNLNRHVQTFPTAKKGYFTYEEFVKFLQTPRDIYEKKSTSGNNFTDEIKKSKKKQIKQAQIDQGLIQEEDDVAELNDGNSTCLLQAEHVRIMRELYLDLDKHNDMIVSRKQYIDKLRSDVRIVKILHLPAVYMPSIDKTMNVDRVLYRIEQEQFIGDADSKSTKEYITWTQFLDYFNDIKSLKKGNENNTKEKIKQIKVFSTIKDNVDDQDELDLEQGIRSILQNEYDNLPKLQETYVVTFQFIESIKMNNKYPQYCNSLSRRKADKFNLKEELLCDTLDRMEAEADEYIDFEEIMEFFTRRGRPKYALKKQEEDKDFKEKFATVPRQKDNENMFNSKMKEGKEQHNLQDSFRMSQNNSNYVDEDQVEEIDGYDSDPETHIYQRGFVPERKNLSRPKSAFNRSIQRSKSPGREIQNSGFQGLSQSITKSYLVDRRINELGNNGSSEDENYSSAKGKRKYNKYNHSDEDEINQRDYNSPQYQQEDDEDENEYQQHIRVGRTRNNNYVDDHQQEYQYEEQDNNPKQNFDSQNGQRGDYKKVMLDYYAGEVSKSKKFKLTKPEPYQFDEREREKKQKKTIRQRKVEEMIEEVREKERKEYNTRSHPKEIPDHVKKPLYGKIMHEQEKRRSEVRANSVAITIQREKPFKFYLRDKNPDSSLKRSKRKTWEERESFVFKANKVPWFCSTNLLEKINRDEELKRQERVAKQAQKTMAMSKLPPRMEKHEQERRARELMEGYSGTSKQSTMNPLKREMFQEPTFQLPKAKTIPNFYKMHSEFQDRLDKQRKGKRPTEVKAFNFQESRKLPPRDYLDLENEMMRQTKTKPAVDKLEEAKKWRNHKPKYQPPSIKKWEQNVERIQNERKEKERQKLQEKKIEEEKLKKREELAKIVRDKYSKNSQTVKLEQNRKEAVERKKKEFKESEEQYLKQKNEIITKVKARPLLMEQKCKGRAYLEKLKTLDRIDNRLKDRGMNSKERQSMYTKDEIKMLQEIKALKARGFKSFRNELDVGDDVSLSPPKEGYDYDQLELEMSDDNLGSIQKKQIKQKKSIDKLSGEGGSKSDKKEESSQLKSFLNTHKDPSQKKGLTDDQLSNLNGLIDDSEDDNKYQQPKNKISQNNFLIPQTKPTFRQTDSVSNMTQDSFDKKDNSILSANETKKNNLKSMKETSIDKKSEAKKESPLIKPAPTLAQTKVDKKEEKKPDLIEEKKAKLKEMKFDSLDSEKSVEEEYQADFDD